MGVTSSSRHDGPTASGDLVERMRRWAADHGDVVEKRMFGGTAFLIGGHMCCGENRGRLVLRLGNDGAEEALRRSHTAPMDFTGKPIRSMIYVDPAGFAAEAELRAWLDQAARHARSLPPKD